MPILRTGFLILAVCFAHSTATAQDRVQPPVPADFIQPLDRTAEPQPSVRVSAELPAPVPTPILAGGPVLPPEEAYFPPLPAKASQSDPHDEPLEASDETSNVIGVRIHPFADLLRVVLLLDRPATYTLYDPLELERIKVSLLRCDIAYFPSELNRINDPRLTGIFLLSHEGDGLDFEFRLPSKEILIDDFELRDPPALVLDFYLDDAERVPLPVSPEFASPKPSLPAVWAVKIDSPETRDPLSGTSSVVAKLKPLDHHSEKAAPRAHAPSAEDAKPRAHEYDDFPIDQVEFTSAVFKPVLAAFTNHQWASALSEGLKRLEAHPDTSDLAQLLILLAEARYQVGRNGGKEGLADQINFYEQALRVTPAGGLRNFAHRRLASLLAEAGRPDEAVPHLEAAFSMAGREAQETLKRDLALGMAATGREAEALHFARELKNETSNPTLKIEMLAIEGKVHQRLGRDADAWKKFQEARGIEANWMLRDGENALSYARAADAMGEINEARRVLAHAVYEGTDYTWTQPAIYLAYADLLRRLAGQARTGGFDERALALEREADMWYTRVLSIADPRDERTLPDLQAARRALRESNAEAIARGAAGYAQFLEGRGQIGDAMDQLRNAYLQSSLSASGKAPLRQAVESILEPYMSWALRQERWPDVIAAWQSFGSELGDARARDNCLGYVAKSLAELGLQDQALEILNGLLTGSSDSPTQDVLVVWRAEVLNKLGRGREAIEELEHIRSKPTLTRTRITALEALADIRRREGDELEAAQVLEELASASDLAPDKRGEAWVEAARLYLHESMPRQAIEIGLRALYFENEFTNGRAPWSDTTMIRVRGLLARAYHEAGRYEEAALTLQHYLAFTSLSPSERGFGQYLLGEARRNSGDREGAKLAYETAQADGSLPEVWRKAALDAVRALEMSN